MLAATRRSPSLTRSSTLLVVLPRTLPGLLPYGICRLFVPIDSDPCPQYNLPAGTVVYTGCVGDDDLAEQLKAANRREGVDEVYQVKKGEQTGACAAIITGHDR